MSVSFHIHPARIGRMFFFLLAPAILSGQTATTFDVQVPQPRTEVHGGNTVTVALLVKNLQTKKASYSARVALPDGWRMIVGETSFDLSPRAEEIRLVTLSIPNETPAGEYRITYGLFERASPGEKLEVAVTVVILPVRRLSIEILEGPRFVVAGSSYELVGRLVNVGNVTADVRVSGRSGDNYVLRFSPSRVLLKPREAEMLSVLVQTVGSIPGKVSHTVEVTAEAAGDSATMVRASYVVDVIPRVAEVENRFLEFPLQVTGRGSGEDDRLGGQVELAGSGSVREDRSDRLDVMVRAPDIQSQSSLGLRDEYRLRYAAPSIEASLGDWSYSLTPLTELSRTAFGGEARVKLAGFRLGGFFNESRFFRPKQRQRAAYAQYEFLPGSSLGLNVLEKQDYLAGSIATVRGTTQLHPLAAFDLEYGRSRGAGASDEAYAVQMSGGGPWLNYDIRHVTAGPEYIGFYRDLQFTSLNLRLVPAGVLRFEAYYRIEDRNRRRDTTRFYAPREEYLQIGGGYSNLFSLSYRRSLQNDRMPIRQYDREEEVAQVRIGLPAEYANLFATVDFGESRDVLGSRKSPFQRYALYGGFNVGSFQQYNASMEYATNRNLFTGELQERISGSLGVTVFLTPSSSVQAGVYANRAFAAVNQDFVLADFTIQHRLPWRHLLVVRGRQAYSTPSINGRELAYSMQYSVPLAVPLKRFSSTGQIRGRVVDQTGKGVGNVLLTVGNAAAISDEDGDFFFPSLPPGKTYALVDRLSIGLENITMQPMPLEIDVRGGEEIELQLNIVRRASIRGDVQLFGMKEADTATVVPLGPKSGVFIECTNSEQTYRRVTDSRGRFQFSDLRPGRWMIRVAGGDIPQFHIVETSEFELLLKPGSEETVAVKIVPKKRTLRIIEEGGEVPVEVRPKEAGSEEPCLVIYDPPSGGYMLQVSSWETRAKAVEQMGVVERITGRKASVERADVPGLGRRFRVKVGLFRTVTEAEAACRRIGEAGQIQP